MFVVLKEATSWASPMLGVFPPEQIFSNRKKMSIEFDEIEEDILRLGCQRLKECVHITMVATVGGYARGTTPLIYHKWPKDIVLNPRM
jgi:hypothetical protein